MDGTGQQGPVVVLGQSTLRTQLLADACRRRDLQAIIVTQADAGLLEHGPQAVLVDLSNPCEPAAVDVLASLPDDIPILALIDRSTAVAGAGALDVELDGYIDVDSDPDELVAALLGGSGTATPTDSATATGLPALTAREHEVLTELLAGDSTTEIGERLGISEHTVRTHVQHVLAKLDVHSRAEAAAVALSAGLRPSGRAVAT